MKVHANAPLGPKGRETMVLRVVEQGWSLAEAAAAAGVSERTCSKWVARYRAEGEAGLVDRSSAPQSVPHRTPRGARRGDRRAAAAADDRARRSRSVWRWRSRPSRRCCCASGWASSRGWSRPSHRTATSAATRASCCTSTSRSSAGSSGGAGHRVTGKRRGNPTKRQRRRPARAPGRLGVRARLRRRRHAPGLRRGPRRREGHHRGRVPAPRDRVLRPPRHQRRARDDRQRLGLPLHDPRLRLPRARRPPPAHPALPAAHQRQGRTLHPHPARRLGLRRDLRLKPRTHRRP